MEAGILFQSLIFGVIGSAYFVYGKKQQSFAFLVSGLGMIFAPYIVENFWALALVCGVFLVWPFFQAR